MKGVDKICRKATRQQVTIYSGNHDAACETQLGDWYLDTNYFAAYRGKLLRQKSVR